MATLRTTTQYGGHVMELSIGGKKISINNQENDSEIGLGSFANDGTFPFTLAGEQFLIFVTERVNCEFSKRNNEEWLKTIRTIHANQEILVSYTPDGSYWITMFTQDQLQNIKEALLRLVHEAFYLKKIPCPQCAGDFFEENGIGHHYRVTHKQAFSSSDFKKAIDLRRELHFQETHQCLMELFEYRQVHENASYERVSVTHPTRSMVCQAKREQEAVELMCLPLHHGGILHPYSKSNNPCKVEVYKRGLHAKFDCWFIMKSEKEHTVSFVVQAYFVKQA
ncbi:hypothetical protein ACROYT_G014524 [Oculina patagonica]